MYTYTNKRWRWSFFINLPIGIICIIFFVLYFKILTEKSSFIEKFKRIDFLGTFTLIGIYYYNY